MSGHSVPGCVVHWKKPSRGTTHDAPLYMKTNLGALVNVEGGLEGWGLLLGSVKGRLTFRPVVFSFVSVFRGKCVTYVNVKNKKL